MLDLPYFFDYKMEFFSFQNNPKDLDPSCKTDLDLWDCLGRVKIGIIAKFHRTDLVTCSHSIGTKPLSYSRINTVVAGSHTFKAQTSSLVTFGLKILWEA